MIRLTIVAGPPVSLKSTVAARLAGILGLTYLPTAGMPQPQGNSVVGGFLRQRWNRYSTANCAIHGLADLRIPVIVDSCISDSSFLRQLIAGFMPNEIVLIRMARAPDPVRRMRHIDRSLSVHNISSSPSLDVLKNAEHFAPDSRSYCNLGEGLCETIIDIDGDLREVRLACAVDPSGADGILAAISEVCRSVQIHPDCWEYEKAVTKHFNDLATDYDVGTEWRCSIGLLERLKCRPPLSGGRVLDIGTGTGLASKSYMDTNLVVGIDPSPRMLSRAAPRLDVCVLGTGSALPFIDRYFDLVLLRQCLHYLDPGRVFRESARVLKPSGRVVVSMSVAASPESKALFKEYKSVTQPLRTEVFTEDLITEFLENSGFIVDEVHRDILERADNVLSRSDELVEPIGGWHAFFSRIESLFRAVCPEAEFRSTETGVCYKQQWRTIWAHRGELY